MFFFFDCSETDFIQRPSSADLLRHPLLRSKAKQDAARLKEKIRRLKAELQEQKLSNARLEAKCQQLEVSLHLPELFYDNCSSNSRFIWLRQSSYSFAKHLRA
jgi:hypothetical protein